MKDEKFRLLEILRDFYRLAFDAEGSDNYQLKNRIERACDALEELIPELAK